MEARALRAGRGAGRALRAGGHGLVEIALGSGGYVRLGERRILVTGPRAPLGPLSLLVGGLPRAGLRPGWPAALEAGDGAAASGAGEGGAASRAGDSAAALGRPRLASVLVIGPLRIALDAVREAPPPPAEPCRPGWRVALHAALAACPAPPAELHPGLTALAERRTAEAFRALAGRGEGLTPAGDDVLAGWSAWRWAQDASARAPGPRAAGSRRTPGFDRWARAHARRAAADACCAPLGLAYLTCAERGELPDPAARTLQAIRAGHGRAAARRARLLTAWGSSSGAALVWGMAAAAGVQPVPHRGWRESTRRP
jgi:hypothetical protein